MKKILISQFIVLLVGTIFAWGNFGYELFNWLKIVSVKVGCMVGATNPFLTPCFYGALFFTLAFILSVISLKKISK